MSIPDDVLLNITDASAGTAAPRTQAGAATSISTSASWPNQELLNSPIPQHGSPGKCRCSTRYSQSSMAHPLKVSHLKKSVNLRNRLVSLAPTRHVIADYLDRETAQIDALVAAKERVLALLAEKRRALITRAVTCGLNPDVPLRESGLPWLGKVPAHWEVERRIALLFQERDERSEPECRTLEVSLNYRCHPRSEKYVKNRIESTAADFKTYKVARKGDVVFNKMLDVA